MFLFDLSIAGESTGSENITTHFLFLKHTLLMKSAYAWKCVFADLSYL